MRKVLIIVVAICFFCSSSLESALLVCKDYSLTNFVGNFVPKVSHVEDYEVIEFGVAEIEAIFTLEFWMCYCACNINMNTTVEFFFQFLVFSF